MNGGTSGAAISTRQTAPERFGNECAFALRVSFTICRITVSQTFLQKLVFSSKRRICTQQITERQFFLGVVRHAYMDMMRAAWTEGRHALYEKHPVLMRILRPVNIAEGIDRIDKPRPQLTCRMNDQDVDNRLGSNIWNSRASKMLEPEIPKRRQHGTESSGLFFVLQGP